MIFFRSLPEATVLRNDGWLKEMTARRRRDAEVSGKRLNSCEIVHVVNESRNRMNRINRRRRLLPGDIRQLVPQVGRSPVTAKMDISEMLRNLLGQFHWLCDPRLFGFLLLKAREDTEGDAAL